MRLVAVATQDINAGQTAAVVYTEGTPANWLTAGAGWWPQPRPVCQEEANCDWHTQRCRQCGQIVGRLVARRALVGGTELTVTRLLAPDGARAVLPYEVSFDASVQGRGEAKSAGAGATLWRMQRSGPMQCVARGILAIPGEASVPRAESQAGRLALELITREGRREGAAGRRCRVVGDNVHVVRYGAMQSRFRVVAQREPVDEGLTSALGDGWALDWQVVDRRHNMAAHRLATFAANWATTLAQQGENEPRFHFTWGDLGEEDPGGLRLPDWP